MASSSTTPPNKAWVTLATNDSYSLGALVLAHSLKTVKTVYKLAILVTPGVTPLMKQKIEAVFDEVKVVDVLDSKDEAHLALLNRPELGVTFTKLHCWTFINYEKCVFLDADTLVLQNCDELFERDEFSAAPDPGWPDCFNTGVFVFKPSQDTFGQLLEFAKTKGSFDGGDQGLLNMFFNDWSYKDISKHLSFTYNVVWSSTYSYLPALKHFGQNMKIIHFITSSKPWLQSFNTETRLVTATTGGSGLQELLQLWWDLFCHHVHPELSTEMGGLAGQFARVSLGEKTTDQMAVEDFLRRQSWEHGNADYLGKDSFSNIWAKINETLSSTPEVKVEPSATKTSSSLEVVLSEEPKPLKSALKKTSTTIPPVESELQIDSNEPPVKQLEKLNLSKDDPNQKTTPDTPTVTSPTPPTTPASQAQESSKPESVKETPKPNVVEPVRETPKPETVEPIKETPKPEAVESVKETPKPETVESVKETPKPDVVESIKEIPKPKVAEPVKETQKPEAVESVKETPKPETAEPVKEIPKTATAEPAKEIPKTETVAPVKEIPKTETVAPLKETPKPDVIESVKETPKTVESVIETQKPESVKEKPKPEVTKSAEAVSTTPAKTPEPVKQTPKADESKKESLASVKLEEVSSISVSSVPKSDEPAKEVSKSAEVPQKPQPSVDDNSAPLESSDPPVAPKRTNKGSSNVPKPAQPSEKK